MENTTQNMSPTIGALSAALSKAQGEFDHAKKDVKNEFFKSKYADLASVIDAARTALSKNGLAVIQTTQTVAGDLVLVTTLSHSSGEWIRGEYPIKPTKQDPQGFGSAMTYARRYSFSAITGIASEDDDGNAASNRSATVESKPKIFATSALRNAFIKNVEDALDKAATLDELSTLMEIYKAKFDDMKASDNEHDKMAIESLRQFYLVVRKRLENPPEIPDDIKEMDEAFKNKIWEP